MLSFFEILPDSTALLDRLPFPEMGSFGQTPSTRQTVACCRLPPNRNRQNRRNLTPPWVRSVKPSQAPRERQNWVRFVKNRDAGYLSEIGFVPSNEGGAQTIRLPSPAGPRQLQSRFTRPWVRFVNFQMGLFRKIATAASLLSAQPGRRRSLPLAGDNMRKHP